MDAAVKGIEAFVDTLMLVTETQNELSNAGGPEEAPAADDVSPAEPMSVDAASPARVRRALCFAYRDTFDFAPRQRQLQIQSGSIRDMWLVLVGDHCGWGCHRERHSRPCRTEGDHPQTWQPKASNCQQ